MKYRTVLVGLFLVPAVWGLPTLVGALTASTEVTCPGENVGADGEERPGPMRPGDTRCGVLDGSLDVGRRDYEEQQRVQSLDRHRDAMSGALLLAYSAAGVLVAWRVTGPESAVGD
jgi:hypothetical protein